MKNRQRCLVALALLASALSGHARDLGASRKIVLACDAAHAPRMTDVGRAVRYSDYWAPKSARQEMLALARQACASGSTLLTFVPAPGQRLETRR